MGKGNKVPPPLSHPLTVKPYVVLPYGFDQIRASEQAHERGVSPAPPQIRRPLTIQRMRHCCQAEQLERHAG